MQFLQELELLHMKPHFYGHNHTRL